MLIFATPSKNVGRALADLAQLVEQLIRNEQVVGSSPIIGSSNTPGKLLLTCEGILPGVLRLKGLEPSNHTLEIRA